VEKGKPSKKGKLKTHVWGRNREPAKQRAFSLEKIAHQKAEGGEENRSNRPSRAV